MIITDYKADNWAISAGTETAWKAKYDVLICQNSVKKSWRYKNKPLSSLGKSFSSYEYIHINGSYY